MENSFVARCADKITGILRGFDRLVFRGTLRGLAYVDGMMPFLSVLGILLKDFPEFARQTTERLKASSLWTARDSARPIQYLASPETDKDKVARTIAARDGVTSGLICVLTSVEPCKTPTVYRNRDEKKLELVYRLRKCLHLYHYMIDPVFGFMNARIQTWFPFNIQICINGREWLARMLDQAGINYRRHENCFPWIEDIHRAQALMDQQLKTAWPKELDRIAGILNPDRQGIFGDKELDRRGSYYWSVYQSEWATDVMFKDARTLREIYRPLLLHAITTYSSEDVLRFVLGRRPRRDFAPEVQSNLKEREEGVRIKHWVGLNSEKAYNKGPEGNLLRLECTLNEVHGFKCWRAKEGEPHGEKAWRPMRKGIADLAARAQASDAANERYMEALGAVEVSAPLSGLLEGVCRHVTRKGRRSRGLRPWTEADTELIRLVSRGEFCVNGLRNRDLQELLYKSPPKSERERRRRTARIGRQIRMLRAHGILRKVPKSHRYRVTPKGRQVCAAILTAQRVSLEQLNKAAA